MNVGELQIILRADIARLQSGMDSARRTVNDATASMSRAADMARSALAGIAAGIGLAQIAQMSDAYAKFTAQLRLASLSTREYTAAYADVKRIAMQSTQGLQETGVLYARIANGTRELGVAQKQVAAITETVNLSLLVSGASASEAASAQLQLSQAFASGTLRGEEFNAVNEAAPRLMLALADGIGVPVGALKKMAEEGAITSKIMADTLPNALAKLREEAKEVQTISGAFTVLKNNMMEFVGIQSNASGAVAGVTGAIRLLADNLSVVAGAVATLTVAKLGTWLVNMGTSAYQAAAANRTLAASTLASAVATTEAASVAAAAKLAEAQANVRTTSTAATLAAARVTELRTAVLAANGAAALAITTNGLIPAQARAIALAEANAIALASQAVAANAATTAALANTGALAAQAAAATFAARAMGVLRGVMSFFGGPIGLIITLLGAAATAWMVWGDKSKEANDKALQSTDETTVEMIARLDKQIEKLKERNRLQETEPRLKGLNDLSDADRDGLARAKSRLDAVRAGSGDFAGQSQTMRQLAEIDILNNYEVALQRVGQAHDETTRAAKRGRDADLKEWYAQNGTAAQKLVGELDGLKKKFGTIPPEMEKLVRAKYADKGAATAIRQEATAYQTLMTSINEKIAANDLELAGYEKLTESQKATIKLDAEIGTGKTKLGPQSIEAARARISVMAQQEESLKRIAAAQEMKSVAEKSGIKNDDEMYAKIAKGTTDIDDQISKLREQIEVYGLTEVAVVDLALAKAQAALAAGPASYAELTALDAQITKLGELRALTSKKQALDGGLGNGAAQAKELLDIMAALDDATKSAASGMAASFGKIGSAIGGLTTALSGYGRTQAAIAAQLAASTKEAAGDPSKIQRANAAAAQLSAQAQVRSYGDMASAAKGFFKENSTGYKALESAEKAYRAVEMAMAVQNMLAKSGLLTAFTGLFAASKAAEVSATVATVPPVVAAETAKQASLATTAMAGAVAVPFPGNIAAFGIVVAMLAAIGLSGFGGGGGSGGVSAVDMQKKQGAGGVFGDSSAQSESITRSLSLLEDHSGSLVPINRGMLSALRAIEASMNGLTNLVVRAPGVVDASNMGIRTGTLSKTTGNAFTDSIQGVINKIPLVGGVLGATLGKLAGLFGKTTQSIVDSGIQFGGSVNDLQAGKGYSQYASVDTTKSSFFGLSKKTSNSVQAQGLNDELSAQFGLVFTGLESALTAAAVGLGIGANYVTKTLDALTIDVTSVSLKGLTGSALTEALNAVLSKAMDQMSEAVFPELDSFRQVGEGYSETVIRLASNYAELDAALGSLGMAFGPVGLGSLAARERLIALAGGIDAFTEQTSSFADNFLTEAERLAPVRKYVADELARLGLAGIETRDDFKAAVLGLSESGAIATAAGAQTFAGLMALEAAFAAVTEKAESAEDQLKRSNSLLEIQAQIYAATNDKVGAASVLQKQHAAALAELDPALREATQLLWNAQAAETAREEALARSNALLDIQAQIYAITGDKIGAAAVLQEQHNAALAAMDPALRSATSNLWGLQAAAAAIASVKADATVKTSNVETALAVVKGFVEREKAVLADGNKAALKGIEDRISADTKAIAKQKSLADALHSALDRMTDSVSLELGRLRAQAQLQAALVVARAGGPLPEADDMKDVLGTLTKDSSELFTTMQDWQRDFYRTQRDIADLSKISDNSLSVDERMLAVLESQKVSSGAMHDSEIARLDGIMEAAQKQVDILNGKDTGMLTLAQALEALNLTILGAKENPILGATGGIVSAYQTALGRQPDVAGLGYWQDRAAAGATQADITGAIKGSPEAIAQSLYRSVLGRDGDAAGISYWTKALGDGMSVEAARQLFMQTAEYKKSAKLPSFDVGNNYLPSDMVAQLHEGERVLPKADNRELMARLRDPSSSNAELVGEIRRLNTTVERLQAAVDQTAANTGKTASSAGELVDLVDQVTEGGNAIRAEIMNTVSVEAV